MRRCADSTPPSFLMRETLTSPPYSHWCLLHGAPSWVPPIPLEPLPAGTPRQVPGVFPELSLAVLPPSSTDWGIPRSVSVRKRESPAGSP